MKSITINNRAFEYQLVFTGSEYGDSFKTEFYNGVEVFYRRRFLIGRKETLSRPKLMFTLWLNIECPSYTKEQIREKVEREVDLLGRKEEIERGEII